ncbi:hypothetical protein KEM48_006843 [Puccinia striiformis f. sp. tritici PST-130]|nr:hypothetical protein KEM48_006843 [Puccinia striiformis f. sp. tritici PST-130]
MAFKNILVLSAFVELAIGAAMISSDRQFPSTISDHRFARRALVQRSNGPALADPANIPNRRRHTSGPEASNLLKGLLRGLRRVCSKSAEGSAPKAAEGSAPKASRGSSAPLAMEAPGKKHRVARGKAAPITTTHKVASEKSTPKQRQNESTVSKTSTSPKVQSLFCGDRVHPIAEKADATAHGVDVSAKGSDTSNSRTHQRYVRTTPKSVDVSLSKPSSASTTDGQSHSEGSHKVAEIPTSAAPEGDAASSKKLQVNIGKQATADSKADPETSAHKSLDAPSDMFHQGDVLAGTDANNQSRRRRRIPHPAHSMELLQKSLLPMLRKTAARLHYTHSLTAASL